MNGTGGSEFVKVVEPILRKVIENIDNPFVWMPLGLFILCILAYPITKMKVFPYLAIAFLIFAFSADWVGRWQNRKTPPEPVPKTSASAYRNDVFYYLGSNQKKAIEMLESGKADAARALINDNLQAADTALKSFPNDADFHALMGYALKDVYQSSKGLLSLEQRKEYLNRARRFFENALQLDHNNASAHNGMGNVLFFEGRFDEALKEHETALSLKHGNYPEAEHDRQLVIAVKTGKIPFDF